MLENQTKEAQRILGKVVGHEISVEELKLIAGGVECGKGKIATAIRGQVEQVCDTPA